MRLDKWLKVSRIIKRRTLAKEVCDGGRVTVNGRPAKASTEVKAGDKVAVDLGNRLLQVEVLATPEAVRADAARDIYRIISD